MRENKIDAIYVEPGSSMFYFTGMRWGTSERMFAPGDSGARRDCLGLSEV